MDNFKWMLNRLLAWIALGAMLFALGCGKSPEDENAVSSEQKSYVKIVSIAPDVSRPIHAGEAVEFDVKAEYKLEEPTGTVTLVIQTEDVNKMPLANLTEVVSQGEGTISLKIAVTIPQGTRTIQIFTPLMATGSTSTTSVDSRAYQVSE